MADKNKPKKTKLKVMQSPDKQVPTEILAQSIVNLSEGMKKIQDSILTERAILVLLKDLTGLPQKDIKAVLDGLAGLEKTYLKKKNA